MQKKHGYGVMKQKFDKPELIFIMRSTADKRGRRVVVRSGCVENTLYRDDIDADTLALIGIGRTELQQIREFLAGR